LCKQHREVFIYVQKNIDELAKDFHGEQNKRLGEEA
jgi:hypothetical protein